MLCERILHYYRLRYYTPFVELQIDVHYGTKLAMENLCMGSLVTKINTGQVATKVRKILENGGKAKEIILLYKCIRFFSQP